MNRDGLSGPIERIDRISNEWDVVFSSACHMLVIVRFWLKFRICHLFLWLSEIPVRYTLVNSIFTGSLTHGSCE